MLIRSGILKLICMLILDMDLLRLCIHLYKLLSTDLMFMGIHIRIPTLIRIRIRICVSRMNVRCLLIFFNVVLC